MYAIEFDEAGVRGVRANASSISDITRAAQAVSRIGVGVELVDRLLKQDGNSPIPISQMIDRLALDRIEELEALVARLKETVSQLETENREYVRAINPDVENEA